MFAKKLDKKLINKVGPKSWPKKLAKKSWPKMLSKKSWPKIQPTKLAEKLVKKSLPKMYQHQKKAGAHQKLCQCFTVTIYVRLQQNIGTISYEFQKKLAQFLFMAE